MILRRETRLKFAQIFIHAMKFCTSKCRQFFVLVLITMIRALFSEGASTRTSVRYTFLAYSVIVVVLVLVLV